MNDKEQLLDRIIDMVIDCCRINLENAVQLNRRMIVEKDTSQNAYMTRIMLAWVIVNKAGFSEDTCNAVFHIPYDKNNPYKTIRRWFDKHRELEERDAYHVAYAQVKRMYQALHEEIRASE